MVAHAWLRLAIGSAAAMLLAMGLGRFSYTAMVPLLIEANWLSASEAGFVGGINLAGFLIGALSAEWLRHKFSLSSVVRASIWLSALALGASTIDGGFYWLAFWRAMLGITVSIIMIFGLAVTTALSPERYRSLGTAIIFAGVGLGIFLSGSLVPWLARLSVFAAWVGVAGVGVAALTIALWGWRNSESLNLPEPAVTALKASTVAQPCWGMLLAAHACFSIGLVPHVIYWVDFIARGLGQGMAIGGAYWSGAGASAVLGPVAAFYLARRIGTSWALVIAFLVLSAGIAAPVFGNGIVILVASTVVFGAQPGLSALISARARDMGTSDAMPTMMRQMISVNAIGAAIAGLAFPALFDLTQNYALLFAVAGASMGLGALLSVPWQGRLRET